MNESLSFLIALAICLFFAYSINQMALNTVASTATSPKKDDANNKITDRIKLATEIVILIGAVVGIIAKLVAA